MSVQRDRARVAAVTGSGAGIGLSIAKALAANGYAVHLADISEARLSEACALLQTEGLEPAGVHRLDVARHADVSKFVDDVVASSGTLDVLVNSAAVFDGHAGIDETTPELWRRVLDINLTGCFYCCREAFPHMVDQGFGRIINIGSIAAFRPIADGLAYDTSKAGLIGMTRRLAIDVAARGVTANVICPGSIVTDIKQHSEEILAGVVDDVPTGLGLPPEVRNLLIPAGRRGDANEVAALALYLASDDAAYLTGQAICIDGGWTAT